MKQKKTSGQIRDLVMAAMLMTVGLILPFLTGQIPQIGSMLLPMHIPVLVCGLICGWQYGGIIGFILPILRYVLFGMPPMPTGIAMSFELASYGIVAGFLYHHSKWQCIVALYRALIAAMICGRIAWGVVSILITGVMGAAFTWEIFMAGAFITAIPGIILQLIFIPSLMLALDRTGIVHFKREEKKRFCINRK